MRAEQASRRRREGWRDERERASERLGRRESARRARVRETRGMEREREEREVRDGGRERAKCKSERERRTIPGSAVRAHRERAE